EATAFATSICQIHFNAWHYSGDHVWAGLARKMFQRLSQWLESGAETYANIGKLRAERAKRTRELAEYERDAERLTLELDKAERAKAPSGFLRSLGSPTYVARVFAYAYREVFNDVRKSWLALLTWIVLAVVVAGVCLFLGSQIRIGIAVIIGVAGS